MAQKITKFFRIPFMGTFTAPVKTAGAAAVLPVTECDKNIPCFSWIELLEALNMDLITDRTLMKTHPILKHTKPYKYTGFWWDEVITHAIIDNPKHGLKYCNTQEQIVLNKQMLGKLMNQDSRTWIETSLICKIRLQIIDSDQTALDDLCTDPECPHCILFDDKKIIKKGDDIGYCDRRY